MLCFYTDISVYEAVASFLIERVAGISLTSYGTYLGLAPTVIFAKDNLFDYCFVYLNYRGLTGCQSNNGIVQKAENCFLS